MAERPGVPGEVIGRRPGVTPRAACVRSGSSLPSDAASGALPRANMKISKSIQMVVWCVLGASPAVAGGGETRVWTRADDGKEITATFLGYDKERSEVRLELSSGQEATVEVAVLSEGDREWVERWVAENPAPEDVPGRYEEITVPGIDVPRGVIYHPAGHDPATAGTRPLCILYDPGGNSRVMVEALAPAADELGWTLAGLDVYSNDRVLDMGMDPLLEVTETAVEHVFETVPHDEDKVVFGGMSGGAVHAYRSTAFIYDDAAAVLAFGGWLATNHEFPYAEDMHVAIVNGDEDQAANGWIERDRESLEDRNDAEVKVFPFPGGHVIAPPPVAAEAARWVHEERGFDGG